MTKTNIVTSDIVLELHVPDFRKVIEFYSILGFKIVWQTPGDEGYLVLKRGRSILNFYSGTEKVYDHVFFSRFPKETVRGYAIEIAIPIADIDSFYQMVVDAQRSGQLSGEIVEELKLKPWNKKDFRMTDPFGFYLRFTEITNWLLP